MSPGRAAFSTSKYSPLALSPRILNLLSHTLFPPQLLSSRSARHTSAARVTAPPRPHPPLLSLTQLPLSRISHLSTRSSSSPSTARSSSLTIQLEPHTTHSPSTRSARIVTRSLAILSLTPTSLTPHTTSVIDPATSTSWAVLVSYYLHTQVHESHSHCFYPSHTTTYPLYSTNSPYTTQSSHMLHLPSLFSYVLPTRRYSSLWPKCTIVGPSFLSYSRAPRSHSTLCLSRSAAPRSLRLSALN